MSISWKNSEQYPDPTAYMALTAVERSERKKYRRKRSGYHGEKKGGGIRTAKEEGIRYEQSENETGA